MKKTIAATLILVLIITTLSGCVTTGGESSAPVSSAPGNAGASDSESSASGVGAASTADVPPSRDTVNLTINSAFISSDAHGNRTVTELTWRTQVYEPLFHLNENTLEYEPRLATEYTIDDTGLIYTFKLRPGVKFHNGEEVKASDVAFSVEHIMQESTWRTFWSNIDRAEVIDDYTVAIHFLSRSAAAMNNISQIWIQSEKEVTEQGESFGTKACMAGTGPYYIDTFNPETNISLKAFPDYWRSEASIKTVNYKVIPEANTASIALEAGELDHYMLVPASSYAALDASDKFNTEVVVANHITYACINYAANEALANDKVREAIAYAIDKEAMSDATFDGHAQPADYMENPKYNVGAPQGEIVYNYDPERAKQLLTEAGYPDGVDVGKILTSGSNYFPDVAVVMQANLAAVGIRAELDVMENSAAIALMRAQDYDIAILGYSNTGDYDSFRQRVHSESVGAYFVKFEGDKFDYKYFDELFAKQLDELEPQKRLEITKELNDAVMETCCLLPLFYKVNFNVWNKDLSVVNAPNYPLVYDWHWS